MIKMRMTSQRKAILETMSHLRTHPTADELYAILKPKMPKISLATVYRNLEVLASQGFVKKLSLGGSAQKRFDGNPEPHWHVHCVKCGRIGDVEVKKDFNPIQDITMASGFDVQNFQIEFWGICPDCKEESQPEAKTGGRRHVRKKR